MSLPHDKSSMLLFRRHNEMRVTVKSRNPLLPLIVHFMRGLIEMGL